MSELSENQAWKRSTRLACMERRTKLPDQVRREYADCINEHLNAAVIPEVAGLVVGFCWPYKSEFDVRFAIRELRNRGSRAALPVVVGKGRPLEFHEWWPGAPMVPGVYDIPIPDGTSRLDPDVVFVPMNAFDQNGYRLGYGGGFFDRTLASISPQPIAIGIAHDEFRLPTIRPNKYDLPMDIIVTETGVHERTDDGLQRVASDQCRTALRHLIEIRKLPRDQSAASVGI